MLDIGWWWAVAGNFSGYQRQPTAASKVRARLRVEEGVRKVSDTPTKRTNFVRLNEGSLFSRRS